MLLVSFTSPSCLGGLQTGFLLGEGKWEITSGMYIAYPAGELVQSYPFPKMCDVGVGSLVTTVPVHSSAPAQMQVLCCMGP